MRVIVQRLEGDGIRRSAYDEHTVGPGIRADRVAVDTVIAVETVWGRTIDRGPNRRSAATIVHLEVDLMDRSARIGISGLGAYDKRGSRDHGRQAGRDDRPVAPLKIDVAGQGSDLVVQPDHPVSAMAVHLRHRPIKAGREVEGKVIAGIRADDVIVQGVVEGAALRERNIRRIDNRRGAPQVFVKDCTRVGRELIMPHDRGRAGPRPLHGGVDQCDGVV